MDILQKFAYQLKVLFKFEIVTVIRIKMLVLVWQ